MGRTKGSKNKSKRSKQYESKNITSLVITFLGVFLAMLIYGSSEGVLSQYISNILGGLFGVSKYVVPIAIFAIGIYGIFNGKEYIKSKFVQITILTIIISSYFSWAHYPYSSDISFGENIAKYYENGVNMLDGGVIGGLLITPIWQAFGQVPSLIILIALTTIFAILVTGMKVEYVFNFVKEAVIDLCYMIRDSFSSNRTNKRGRRKEQYAQETDEGLDFEFEEEEQEDELQEDEEIIEGEQIELEQWEEEENEEDEEFEQKKKEAQEKLAKSGLFKTKTKQEVLEEQDDTIEELDLTHNELENIDDYIMPDIKLLNGGGKKGKANNQAMKETAEKLQTTLRSFGVKAKVINVSKGPSVTRYELQPDVGVKVSQIVNLSDDIALNLAASSLRIEAPIPGKAAIGIEIPNDTKDMITLREMLETKEFKNAKSKLSYALGRDIAGNPVISNIAEMPHMLISGATGSGKSVCVNTIIMSILYKAKPNEVKFLMIDPKVVELGIYNGIPHLLIPVVTDPKKAAGALNWAVQEMVLRYNLFAQKGVKDLKGYNELLESENEDGVLPQIVIIIDELADLMMVAKHDVEDAICRLAQMARAAGMYLIIATQRPSVDVITGIIKANIPSRIAFSVSSQIDSRTIIDTAGAEKLLGKGDMLYYPNSLPKPIRLQGPFVSEAEIEKVVEFIKDNCSANYDEDIIDKIENSGTEKPSDVEEEDDDVDSLLMTAIDMVVEYGQASTSMLQRRLKVGYARAGRIIDQMEARGIISGYDGSKPRQVLISKQELQQLKMGNNISIDDTFENDAFEEDEDDENKITTGVVDGDYE